ncbi:hypothetical protein [Kineosporia succinea]|uniref:PknH-like protein n=1 Tax=Kineosporia succinea TaxID=84632 RepID=A0ABT9P8X1_9ACTN|nr:hypothetical protein [Kineosporia succinea]MDP9829133.1 hypothetical protein [Kineosporia succinea]
MEGGEEPELDLDRPADGDAQVVALFRDGLRAGPTGLDPRGIERRARRRHRRAQAVASSAVTAAAALAAVLVIASPWQPQGGDEGVPAGPGPSLTATAAPDLTAASLIDPDDITLGSQTLEVTEPASDISGEELVGGVCVDGTLGVDVPTRAFEAAWSTGRAVPADYVVREKAAQWPGQPGQAAKALETLRSQLESCTAGPGPEGLGVTTDRTGDLAMSAPYLVVTATEGTGTPYAQAFLVWDDTLVTVSVGGPESASEDDAYRAVIAVLEKAVGRITAGGAPGGGA